MNVFETRSNGWSLADAWWLCVRKLCSDQSRALYYIIFKMTELVVLILVVLILVPLNLVVLILVPLILVVLILVPDYL